MPFDGTETAPAMRRKILIEALRDRYRGNNLVRRSS